MFGQQNLFAPNTPTNTGGFANPATNPFQQTAANQQTPLLTNGQSATHREIQRVLRNYGLVHGAGIGAPLLGGAGILQTPLGGAAAQPFGFQPSSDCKFVVSENGGSFMNLMLRRSAVFFAIVHANVDSWLLF
jgi:hypothetical protein